MSFTTTKKSRLIAGASVLVAALMLTACGGGGGSSSPAPTPPSGGTPPPTPPVAAATKADPSVQSQTGVATDQVGDVLPIGSHRARSVGEQINIDVSADGKFTVSSATIDGAGCDVNGGQFENSASLEITAKDSSEGWCLLTISSDSNSNLWSGEFAFGMATDPTYLLEAGAMREFDFSSADTDADGYCGDQPASFYNTYGVGDDRNTIHHTSETLNYTTLTDDDGNSRVLCEVEISAPVSEGERRLAFVPLFETVLSPSGSLISSGGNASSPISYAEPTIVKKGQEFLNLADSQFSVGTRGSGSAVPVVGGQTVDGITLIDSTASFSNGDNVSVANAYHLRAGLTAGQGSSGLRDVVFEQLANGKSKLRYVGSAE